MMALSGVRSSWLMLARKLLMLRRAASACLLSDQKILLAPM